MYQQSFFTGTLTGSFDGGRGISDITIHHQIAFATDTEGHMNAHQRDIGRFDCTVGSGDTGGNAVSLDHAQSLTFFDWRYAADGG